MRSRRCQARCHAALAERTGRCRDRHRHRRRAVAPALRAWLSRIRHQASISNTKSRGYPRQSPPGPGARGRRTAQPEGTRACSRSTPRARTRNRLKFTLPGPMTIVDTLADRHYGDRRRWRVTLRSPSCARWRPAPQLRASAMPNWSVVENRRLSDGRIAQRQVALFPAGLMPAHDVDAISVRLSEPRLERPRQRGGGLPRVDSGNGDQLGPEEIEAG